MRYLKWAVVFIVLAGIVAATVPFWPAKSTYDEATAQATLSSDKDALIARGKYLVAAADCVACHQSPDGAPFAGGLPIETPFGVIHGTNITPDADNGIGAYSSADMYHAIADGIRKDGQWLYPAMPYASYHEIRQEDSDAIYAYLMTQTPVKRANPATDLPFPFNQRWLLSYWNLVNPKISIADATSGSSDHNGAYLTEVLGHCQECHTPRNLMGGLKLASAYEGGVLGKGILAPSLTPAGLAERGWTAEDLRIFLKAGIAPQGTMTLEMFPVLDHSTQYLNEEDIAAIQGYLTGETLPSRQPSEAPKPTDPDAHKRGRDTYVAVCAGCHGIEGEGKPHIAPPMTTNTSLRLADPSNLLHVLLDGVPEQHYPNGEVMQEMPGFAQTLSEQELIDLANYMRVEWGGQPAILTTETLSGDLAVSAR